MKVKSMLIGDSKANPIIKINKRIEIVHSTRSWPGSMRQAAVDAVFAVLTKHYARVEITTVNDVADLEALVARKPDLVFLGIKFTPVNLEVNPSGKIWVADYLDGHSIPYTGSNQRAHELDIDKPSAKQKVLDAGLRTSPFYVAKQNLLPLSRKDMLLEYPVFIKPTDRGDGIGIDGNSVAHNYEELQSKVRSIAIDLQSDSLIEKYLPGREFSVAILKNERSNGFSVMPIELIAPQDKNGSRILGKQVKSLDTESSMEIADETSKSKVTKLALNVFHAVGARDYGRVDIRMDNNGTPHFLETNLLPSLRDSPGNYFPKACMLNIQLSYEAMILNIVRLALNRQKPTFQDGVSLNTPNILSPSLLGASN